MLTRRSLFGGLGALLAAPAIVRVASIMPVSAPKLEPVYRRYSGYDVLDMTADVLRFKQATFSNIIHDVLMERQGELAANVQRHNALLRRLMSRGEIALG